MLKTKILPRMELEGYYLLINGWGGREGGGGNGGENLNSDVQAIISLHKPIIIIITLTVEPLKATTYGLHILFYGLHILLHSKIMVSLFYSTRV